MRTLCQFLGPLLSALLLGPAATLLGMRPQDAPQPLRENPLHQGESVPPGAIAAIDGQPVPVEDFIDEMVKRYTRPGAEGERVIEALEEETLIRRAAEARAIEVSDAEVDARVAALDAQCREQSGKALEQMLRENSVPLAAFRKKTRGLVALEKIAREDLKIPSDREVEPFHLKVWLKQARETAEVVRDPARLPAEAVSSVDGESISRRSFVRELLLALDATEVRKLVDTLLQEVVVNRLLATHEMSLSEADIRSEWEYRKSSFESDPLHQGIRFEDIVKQQTGLSSEEFCRTRGFRVNAGLALLSRRLFSPAQMLQTFQDHQSVYGPRLHVRHVLVLASDNPELRGRVRTMAEGLERAHFVLQELEKGVSFEDLARLYSEDQSTRFRGGEMAVFTPGRNPHEKALVDAVVALEPLQVSEPVQTTAGWHLLRLDRRDPTPPLEEVEPDLRRQMAREFFRETLSRARIGVDVRLP